MLIIVEGIDGAGKSSVIEDIKKFLENKSTKRVNVIKFPSNSPAGIKAREEIAKGVKDEDKFVDLLGQDFNHTIITQITPLLRYDNIVICDRYTMSFLAYQNIITESFLEDLPALWKTNYIDSKLTILLDIDPRISLKRITWEKDAIENRGIEYFDKVRESFIRLANLYTGEDKIKIIDASRSKEEVSKDVLAEVDKLFKNWKQN